MKIKKWFCFYCLLKIAVFLKFSKSSSSTVASTLSSDSKSTSSPELSSQTTIDPELVKKCRGNCTDLNATCYNCTMHNNCTYGSTIAFDCRVKNGIVCDGNQSGSLKINFQCRYCFLTKPNDEHICKQNSTNCSVSATPKERIMGTCDVNERVFCLGSRTFKKMMPCSWTSGYRWSTAFALSITVGGFGVDRFYLGYWREGLGKLFSFGGLGVWTIIDVVLIGTGYLSPSDGSLYV